MGSIFSRMFAPKHTVIFMAGLAGAGKTTILYKMKLGAVSVDSSAASAAAGVALELEQATYKTTRVVAFDLPDAEAACATALAAAVSIHGTAAALIFVVDATDHGSFAGARARLEQLCAAHGAAVPLLLFAHKQDMPNASNAPATAAALGLAEAAETAQARPSVALGSMGNTGEGLYEGLDWLVQQLHPR
ncbi:ADP-ribosylation factor family-domain-containing protein [Baffinella frigidus]|nr:ADP-ribosylation factor family-domain-containing protein [Cryptophyta sp. CCMP2293]